NPSYVFFRELPADLPGPLGSLGVPLTPERSIAVDVRVVPLGSPVYLATTWPNSDEPLIRLMAAQDTGGAIAGGVRPDFLWGFGELLAQHRVEPRLAAVGRAPDRLRLVDRVLRKDRVKEDVDGDVGDPLQVALEALAIAAMRILEDRDLARAVAARDLDRGIERQVAELDGVHLAQPRFGEVLLRVQGDDVAHEQERGV